MSRPDEIRTVMDMVSSHGAKALRVPEFGVAVGAMADLVVLDACEAHRWVIRKGKLIAETSLETYRYFDLQAAPAQ